MNAGCAGKTVRSLENVCHKVGSRRCAIQIHVYLHLTLPLWACIKAENDWRDERPQVGIQH